MILATSPAARAQGARRAIGPALLLSLAVVPATWWLPLFTARVPFLWRQEVSVASGLVELWRLDPVLFVVLLVFSVLAPLAKNTLLVFIWYRTRVPVARQLLHRAAILGKLAMAEVFLLAVIIVGFKGVGIGKVEVAWGLYGFTAAMLLALVASTWAWSALEDQRDT